MPNGDHFLLGQNSADIETLKEDVRSIKADVRMLVENEERRKGERKAVAAAGGFAGAVFAFAANFIMKLVAERP